MFIGHFAAGMAGKAVAPRVSLGTWFLSAQLLDLLWPVFLLLDREHVRITPGYTRLNPLDFYDYPLSHSLLAALFWGTGLGLAWLLLRGRRGKPRGRRAVALLLGLGVVSHWLLDVVVHRADLPVLPLMGPYVGLGLWNLPAAALAVELALAVAGAALYLRSTRALDGAGRWGFWALLLFLLAVWLGSLFGPPPPDERSIAWAGLAQWLLVPWAWWVDRHRAARAPELPSSPQGIHALQ